MNKNNDWFKLSQKVFILFLILGAIFMLSMLTQHTTGAEEGWGAAMAIFLAVPVVTLISVLVIVGSLMRFKTLSKADWAFFILSLVWFMIPLWLLIQAHSH